MYFEAKKSLKQLAIALKSDTSLLFIKKGAIIGTFSPKKKVFIMDQYVLELVLGSFIFLAK